jgi:hypothetical protein
LSTYWLRDKLAKESDAITDGGDPVLTIDHSSGTVRVYCPTSDEYAVDADVVEKALGLGANVIAYATTWCSATYEAKAYGKAKGVDVIPYAGLFGFLRRKGVTFYR